MSAVRATADYVRDRLAKATRSQLRVNIASGLVSNVVNALITIVGYRIYLTYLGYERYGLWLILATVLTVVQLGNFGISPALLKLVAEDLAGGDIPGVYRYIAAAMAALGSFGLLLVGAIWLLRPQIVGLFALSAANYPVIYSMLPLIALLSVYVILVDALNAALAGLGRYDLVNYSLTGAQLVGLCVTTTCLRLGWGLWSFMTGVTCNYVFLNICSVVLIARVARGGGWRDLAIERARLVRLVKFGSWVFGGSIVALAVNPVNRVMISRFIGVSAIPIFDIANQGTMRIRNFLEIAFRPLMPELSGMQGSGAAAIYERLRLTGRAGARFILYWGAAFHLAVFVAAGWALRIWLGPRYLPALPPVFRIMLVGAYVSLWSVQSYYTLLAFGRNTNIFFCFVIQLALNAGSVLAISALRGGTGVTIEDVAIGACIGTAGMTGYLRWQSYRLRMRYRDAAITDRGTASTRAGL